MMPFLRMASYDGCRYDGIMYMMVVYRHCQPTFQYNQLVKVHVPLYYDPFKGIVHFETNF